MLIFYTDKFIPKDAAGCTRGPVIFIRPKYKDDKGLLEHENIHRWQWVFTLGFHSFLYLLYKPYRLWSEVQAYKMQLRYPPANGSDSYKLKYANYISKNYGLNVTSNEAYSLLYN